MCNNVITQDKDSEYRYELNKQFVHTIHCKLLNEKYVFIVRKLNMCEIRKLDETFTVVESFVHIGDEVYAVDVGYHCLCANTETNENCEENKDNVNANMNGNDVVKHQHEDNNTYTDNNNNVQLYQHTNIQSEKIILDNEVDLYNKVQCSSNNISVKTNVLNTQSKKVNNDNNEIGTTHVVVVGSGQKNNNTIFGETYAEKNKDDIEHQNCQVVITLLDIDGNVNVYEKGNIRVEFNLYDVENIDKEHKDKQFFSMGYSYYTKYNGEFFAISSDHGCYIIQRSKE